MKKKPYSILLLLIAAVVGYGVHITKKNTSSKSRNSAPSPRSLASNILSQVPQEMSEKELSKNTSPPEEMDPKFAPTITAKEINRLHQNYPNKVEVEEDIKKNPHSPSKILMMFAKELGPLMEKALKNENDANVLMRELHFCANDKSVADAARALCVQDTERLAEVFPKFDEKASDLRSEVSPEVQKILDTNDAFIKK